MKGAIYTRFSTDKQQSTEMQILKCREYAKANDIEVVAIYSDEAATGTNLNRGGFDELVYAAQNKEFECILIYNVKRGSRDVADWFNFRKLMHQLGIKVISCSERLGDIYNASDFLVELINVGIGQHEVLNTRQASIDGKTALAHHGLFMGGFAPLGYDIKDRKYMINEKESEYVKLIFSAYAAGRSYDYIVNELHKMGAVGKRGRPLGKNSLSSILTNEAYIGKYVYNKYIMREMHKWAGYKPNPNRVEIDGAIPAIIDKETWEKVRKRMKTRKMNAKNTAKCEYLLSGLITCGRCGAAYVGHARTNKKGYTTRYYECGNRYRTKTCKNMNYNADIIETEVMIKVQDWVNSIDITEISYEIVRNYNKTIKKGNSALAQELREVEHRIKRATEILLQDDFPSVREELRKAYQRQQEIREILDNPSEAKPLTVEQVQKILRERLSNIKNLSYKEILANYVDKIIATDNELDIIGGHKVVFTTGSSGRI